MLYRYDTYTIVTVSARGVSGGVLIAILSETEKDSLSRLLHNLVWYFIICVFQTK